MNIHSSLFNFEHSYLSIMAVQSNKSKEQILARIRAGLAEESIDRPFPEVEGQAYSEVFEVAGASTEEMFAENFIRLGGKFVFCEDEKDLLEGLFALYESRNWSQMLCADQHILKLLQQSKVPIALPAENHAAGADACITDCEMLVARTGSVIFSSGQHMGRTASVFYPVHIIVAYANQIVNDLEDGITVLKKRYPMGLPSMVNLNTGPSRTADIEKTLVVGIHGPGEVFCFYVNNL